MSNSTTHTPENSHRSNVWVFCCLSDPNNSIRTGDTGTVPVGVAWRSTAHKVVDKWYESASYRYSGSTPARRPSLCIIVTMNPTRNFKVSRPLWHFWLVKDSQGISMTRHVAGLSAFNIAKGQRRSQVNLNHNWSWTQLPGAMRVGIYPPVGLRQHINSRASGRDQVMWARLRPHVGQAVNAHVDTPSLGL